MKFAVNDKVYSKKYGKGRCCKIDEKNKDFTYFFKFYDRTHIWMSKEDAERFVKHRKNNTVAQGTT